MERVREEDGAINGRFTTGNPTNGGQFPTKVMPYWLNNIQEEIVNAITLSNIALDPSSQKQLHKAMKKNSAFNIIVEEADDLQQAIYEAPSDSTIFVRPMVWEMTSGPLILNGDSMFLQFSPGCRLIGIPQNEENQGLDINQGILEVYGSDCTILGGTWDFAEPPENQYHAIRHIGSVTANRPFFGMSRIKSGFQNNTTLPLSATVPF